INDRAEYERRYPYLPGRIIDNLLAPKAKVSVTRCLVPECGGISQADPSFRDKLWDRYSTAAPRPRTPSEQRYSDRRLRSKNSQRSTV
ncbi:hypothetical protein EOA33_27725, partial [Mesorhizobium sp. M4A.F.Ca.ET.050.02.1.1]